MSQPQTDQASDVDPLLEFSIEPSVAALPPHQREPIAPTEVASPAMERSLDDDSIAMRSRLDRLEKAVEQAATEVRTIRSDVATLVAVTADFKRQIARRDASAPVASKRSAPRRIGQFAGAIAAVLIGVAAGIWFWTMGSGETLVPAPPVVIAKEAPAPPQASPIAEDSQPGIVAVAAVTPVRNEPVRLSPPRTDYVGTLSIDSDPAGEVFIDRRPAGSTPLTAGNLRAGSHLVWIQRDGYRRFTRVVQVPSDRVTRLVADLEPVSQR